MGIFLEKIFSDIEISESKLNEYSPLVWAYVGDAVYEVLVRTHISLESVTSVQKLHKKAVTFVSAKAQAEKVKELTASLTEDELDIVRRGRNCKSATVPKNANIEDYKYSTGFEALIGYLFLKKDFQRVEDIFRLIVSNNKK